MKIVPNNRPPKEWLQYFFIGYGGRYIFNKNKVFELYLSGYNPQDASVYYYQNYLRNIPGLQITNIHNYNHRYDDSTIILNENITQNKPTN